MGQKYNLKLSPEGNTCDLMCQWQESLHHQTDESSHGRRRGSDVAECGAWNNVARGACRGMESTMTRFALYTLMRFFRIRPN